MKIQEALDILKHDNRWKRGEDIKQIKPAVVLEAIDTLISFTEKVLGEPSEAMVEATITSFNDNGNLALVSHAKAYINQAEKELEE